MLNVVRRGMLVAILAVGLVLAQSESRASTGIGIAWGAPDSGPGLSLRFDRWFVGATWSTSGEYLGVNVDYIIINGELTKNLGFYVAPGANAAFASTFGLAAECPVGLNWTPIPELEIFGQFGPAIPVIPDFDFSWNGAFGIRYVF